MQEPMYIKIHNQLRRDIENHVYQVGDRIPAERQLAEQFKVSRMTLRQAIKTLEEEGILERRLGSGTYVASQKVQEKMSGIMSFTEITRANGQTPSSKLVSYKITQPSLSEKERQGPAHGADPLCRPGADLPRNCDGAGRFDSAFCQR